MTLAFFGLLAVLCVLCWAMARKSVSLRQQDGAPLFLVFGAFFAAMAVVGLLH